MAHGYPDFEGDKSGLYLKPEWAAIEGTYKNFYASASNMEFAGNAQVTYTVPAGKTLYIVSFSAVVFPAFKTDYDHHLWVRARIRNATTGTNLIEKGGAGGCGQVLSNPLVFPAGEIAMIDVFNQSNLTCNVSVTALGYEV